MHTYFIEYAPPCVYLSWLRVIFVRWGLCPFHHCSLMSGATITSQIVSWASRFSEDVSPLLQTLNTVDCDPSLPETSPSGQFFDFIIFDRPK